MKEQKIILVRYINNFDYLSKLFIILLTIMSRVTVVVARVSNTNAAAFIRPSTTSQYARRTISFVANKRIKNSDTIAFLPYTSKTTTIQTTNKYYKNNDWTILVSSSSRQRISPSLYSTTTSSSISSSINNTQTSSSSIGNNNDYLQQNNDIDSKDKIVEIENDINNNNNSNDDNNDEIEIVQQAEQNKKKKKERKITPKEINPVPPWNSINVINRIDSRSLTNVKRARQHVNPLAYQFQLPTVLHEHWPNNSFTIPNKPLHLDIGCGRGGFLLELIQYELLYIQQSQQNQNQTQTQQDISNSQSVCFSTTNTNSNLQLSLLSDLPYNYLGLEIRPIVVANAIERIKIHNVSGVLDFIGCNVNIDLQRILHLYHTTTTSTNTTTNIVQQGQEQSSLVSAASRQQDPQNLVNTMTNSNNKLLLEMVTIQFPDPLFKSKHRKRHVVTNELIYTLASYMPPNATVFLQSDIQSVLDTMRQQFRENDMYFQDSINDCTVYEPNNIFSIPTEREIGVLERNLPIYRAIFTRTNNAVMK